MTTGIQTAASSRQKRPCLFRAVTRLAFLCAGVAGGWAAEPALSPAPPPDLVTAPAAIPAALQASTPLGLAMEPVAEETHAVAEPTDDEQLCLEFINRARANPAEEAQRLLSTTDLDVLASYQAFGVDLTEMARQIAALPPAPPLAMNAQLLAAARRHSQDMLLHGFQDHQGSDGSTPPDRARAAGYAPVYAGENVCAYARSVDHAHAAFEVDFGPVAGMQNPPGHRQNLHHPVYREAGIAIVPGRIGLFGPLFVTQDFGCRADAAPLVTGVVYCDVDGDGCYDRGEGIGGVQVQVDGLGAGTVTGAAGGYALPLAPNQRHTVRFELNGCDPRVEAVDVETRNVKVDCRLNYTPPILSGPDPIHTGQRHSYQFTAVPGATVYHWDHRKRLADPWLEGAEAGLDGVALEVSPGAAAIAGDIAASGNASFHLCHTAPEDQVLTLQRELQVGSASELRFFTRLGWACTGQVARAQISINHSGSWQDLWSRRGDGSYGQSRFEPVACSLAPWAGQEVRIRFLYDYLAGPYFPQTTPGVGFYLDNITVLHAEQLVHPQSAIVLETQLDFAPGEPGGYCLRVRPEIGGRLQPWGPLYAINAQPATNLVLRFEGPPALIDGYRRMHVRSLGVTAPGALHLERAPALNGPWRVDAAALVEPAGSNCWNVLAPPTPGIAFYRLLAR